MNYCRTPSENAARWREAGIPDGYTLTRLLYNPASQVLVAELRGAKDSNPPERLVMRHKDSDRFDTIGGADPDLSFESAVTCENEPILVFNSKRWHRDSEGHRGGANWDGLYVLNLRTGELDLRVSERTLTVPPPYDERGWVSGIISLSDDAGNAYVKVGLGKRFEDGERTGVKYDYHLARLDVRSGELALLSHLKNIWF